MNTVEDFKKAPAGATATGPIGRAMKMVEVDRYWMADRYWMSQDGVYFSDVTMEFWGFTLDLPTPTTAREALALAWKLAHPVREGQAIPKGTRYLKRTDSGLAEFTAEFDFKVVSTVRTLEKLPDPEPDWQDAPTTASVVLSILWKLAYPVKEGQVIPKGAQYLERYPSGVEEHTAQIDIKIIPALVPMVRTFDPLPDPEPDWQEAPAVLAATSRCPDRKVWAPESGGVWKCSCCRDEVHWYELVDVTPLYPEKE